MTPYILFYQRLEGEWCHAKIKIVKSVFSLS
jgi:hypothetical protein